MLVYLPKIALSPATLSWSPGQSREKTTMAYRCPLCEYTADSKSAVGAHVSSKIDDAHKGEFGSGVEDEIEPVATDGGAPESDSDTVRKPSMPSDGDAPSADPPEDDDDLDADPIDYDNRLDDSDGGDVEDMPGLPITPVAKVAVALVAIVIVLYLVRSRSDPETTPTQQEEEGDEFDPDAALEAMSERNTRPGGVT